MRFTILYNFTTDPVLVNNGAYIAVPWRLYDNFSTAFDDAIKMKQKSPRTYDQSHDYSTCLFRFRGSTQLGMKLDMYETDKHFNPLKPVNVLYQLVYNPVMEVEDVKTLQVSHRLSDVYSEIDSAARNMRPMGKYVQRDIDSANIMANGSFYSLIRYRTMHITL